jgi:hypothetical protein
MKKILEYREYLDNKELLEGFSQDSPVLAEFSEFISESINESSFVRGGDQILNNLSKALFGSLSKVSMIDQTVDKIYQLKAKLIDQEYNMIKEFDKIQDKVKELRSSGASPEMVRSVRKQRDAKQNEFDAFEKRTNLEIERGMKLLGEIIGNNKRRQEYSDSVISQAEVNLADYEYKKAKKEGKASEAELKQLLSNLEDKKEELKDETQDLKDLAAKQQNPKPKVPVMKVSKPIKTA